MSACMLYYWGWKLDKQEADKVSAWRSPSPLLPSPASTRALLQTDVLFNIQAAVYSECQFASAGG